MLKILVLGVGGMLGHVLFKTFLRNPGYEVRGTARNLTSLEGFLTKEELKHVFNNVDAFDFDTISSSIKGFRPDMVINCIGIIKHLPEAKSPLIAITINSVLPHRLAQLCESLGVRLVHFSTDCVFKGDKGNYQESDQSDAEDLYGRTKFLGELSGVGSLTIRTSIIGHELRGNVSLVDWFLSQSREVRGYENAIYTGFPTTEMARILQEKVIPCGSLSGLYQVSSSQISKLELLRLIAERYGKDVEITPDPDFKIDRSLDSTRFRRDTSYAPPSWNEMIESMHEHFCKEECYAQKRKALGL